MRSYQDRLVFFDALNCSILKLIQREFVRLSLDFRTLEARSAIVSPGIHCFMHAIFKLNCLYFIIVDIIAKLADTSYFIFVIAFVVITTVVLFFLLSFDLLVIFPIHDAVVLLDLGKNASTFGGELLVFPLHEVIVAGTRHLHLKLGSRLPVAALIDNGVLLLLFLSRRIFVRPSPLFIPTGGGCSRTLVICSCGLLLLFLLVSLSLLSNGRDIHFLFLFAAGAFIRICCGCAGVKRPEHIV